MKGENLPVVDDVERLRKIVRALEAFPTAKSTGEIGLVLEAIAVLLDAIAQNMRERAKAARFVQRRRRARKAN